MTRQVGKSLQDAIVGSIRPDALGRRAAHALRIGAAGMLALSVGAGHVAFAADPLDTADAKSLGEVDRATPRDPNNEGLVWTPSPCKEGAVEIEPPADTSAEGWEAALAASLARVKSLGEAVDNVTELYTGTLDRAALQPTERVKLGQARDAARRQYSESRCEFEALKEAARSDGVLPGVLRKYELPPVDGAGDD